MWKIDNVIFHRVNIRYVCTEWPYILKLETNLDEYNKGVWYRLDRAKEKRRKLLISIYISFKCEVKPSKAYTGAGPIPRTVRDPALI